jgi:hypothetical protein
MNKETEKIMRRVCSDYSFELGTVTLAWCLAGGVIVTMMNPFGVYQNLMDYDNCDLFNARRFFNSTGAFIATEIVNHELRRRAGMYTDNDKAEFLKLLRSYVKAPEVNVLKVRLKILNPDIAYWSNKDETF